MARRSHEDQNFDYCFQTLPDPLIKGAATKMPNGDVSFDANETPEARHMEDDIWADRAFYDDGEWVHWSEIEEQVRFKEWGAKYPNARKSLIPYFEELLSLAEGYHMETGLHLNVYGDIGELYGAITHGLKLHKTYAQGSDGRLGERLHRSEDDNAIQANR